MGTPAGDGDYKLSRRRGLKVPRARDKHELGLGVQLKAVLGSWLSLTNYSTSKVRMENQWWRMNYKTVMLRQTYHKLAVPS